MQIRHSSTFKEAFCFLRNSYLFCEKSILICSAINERPLLWNKPLSVVGKAICFVKEVIQFQVKLQMHIQKTVQTRGLFGAHPNNVFKMVMPTRSSDVFALERR